MKKILKTGVLLLLICAAAVALRGNVLAADEDDFLYKNMQPTSRASYFGKDWSVMVGAKAWYNEWDLPFEIRAQDKTLIYEFESDAEITYIPALLVRYRNYFIGGTYLLETDYNFPKQQTMVARYDPESSEWAHGVWNTEISGSRTERDLNFGYFLTPNLAISLGYKELERDIAILDRSIFDENYFFHAVYPLSAHAPIIGISAAAPVGNRLNLYGNLAYGWLSGDATYKFWSDGAIVNNDMEIDGKYTFAELGLNYTIPIKENIVSALSISAGYRFQRLDMKFENKTGVKSWGNSGDQHDATAGFVLGVNVAM